MHHQTDSTDDNQHHHRDRIEQNTHINMQRTGERQPFYIIRSKRREYAFGSTSCSKIIPGSEITEKSNSCQRCRTNQSGYPMLHVHTSQPQYQEAQYRQ